MNVDAFFLFPPFWLDVRNEQLWRRSQAIALRPKTFAVLRYLVAQAGQLVTQAELLDAVWGLTAISDVVVRSSIRELRAALGDKAQRPQFIQTVHRRGYRFIAPVSVADAPQSDLSPAPSAPARTPRPAPPDSEAIAYPPTGSILDDEHKLVTVLCCAVTDAPALAAHQGPEAMHHLMQAFFGLAQEVLQRYDGTITHVTGEGFTALFGAPVGQEDHARRAVLAAVELGQRLRPQPGGVVHAAGMGIHTGPVVVGRLVYEPQRLYTAVGDTMHQAIQVQRLATPGTILMSAATYRLMQEEVKVEVSNTPDINAQGMRVPVYTVQGLAQRRAGVSGQGACPRSRFVGRVRELALLHARLAHVAQGYGQVVGIVGEPGMGKSRLLAEFRRSLAGQPVTYREGHCLPYGSTTSYLLVRDLLYQGCGITDADGVEVIMAKVHRYLEDAQLMPKDEIPLMLQLLDVPVDDARLDRLSPRERKVRTFALLRHLVLHDSRRQPLVLAVENLHWVDATSEEWLSGLVDHLVGTGILLLTTYRPGYWPPWSAQSVVTQMALPRFLSEESLAVVQSVLQTTSLPEPLLQTIVTKAAGNPFFLEELTWDVMEQRPAPTVPGIPDTIQAVLAARIDRLPPEEKRLLQTAAVIGTEVPLSLLQALAEVPEDSLHRGLAHLQATEFLYETRLFPEREYTFKHALTHEVAYGGLLQKRRQALHTRIVEVLEALYADRVTEQVERLAYHARQGEVWEKTLVYFRQAGEKAMARSAHWEAVADFEQALSALRHLPEQRDTHEQAIDLRLALRSALFPSGDGRRILKYLREAESLAEGLDDPKRLGQVSRLLSQYFFTRGAHDQAIAFAEKSLTLATTGGDAVLHALTNFSLGSAYLAEGNYHRAIDSLEQTMGFLGGTRRRERFGQVILPAVSCRARLAECHAELGTFVEGSAIGDEGLRIAEAVDHRSSIIVACEGIGLLAIRQGNLRRALPLLERAVGICREADLPVFFSRMAATLGAAYALCGRVADAVPLLTQAMEVCTAPERVHFQTLCSLLLGEAHLRAGLPEEAYTLAQRVLALARAQRERGHEAYTLRLLGEIAARRDAPEIEQAEVSYLQALALAEALAMRPLQAHCHLGLGSLYLTIGQGQQAHAALTTAIDLYRIMRMTFWLPQAEAALSQVEKE